jgi:uncharacterized protein (TIGR03435 family)
MKFRRLDVPTSIRTGFLIFLMPLLAFGQAAGLSFEVASIKPAQPITPDMIASGKLHVGMSVQGPRVDIGYMSLADLVPIAYGLKPHQISGPDWMPAQRFDILAKLPEGTTRDQVPEMLRALLEERFQLKARREKRDLPVYALEIAKGGSKLKESPPDAEVASTDAQTGGVGARVGNDQLRVNREASGVSIVSSQGGGSTKMSVGPGGQMHLEMSKITMAAFADMLTRFLDRPVIDETGLSGNYQIALDPSMENLMSVARLSGIAIPTAGLRGDPARPVDASDPSGGSIFASVQQLGLKLDSRKAPTEFFVIEHVEKRPTEN